jgi:hypothetical protein
LQDEINKKIQKADADEEVKDEDLDEEAERIKAEQIANKKAKFLEHMQAQID